jgi:AcrR family transcriptional regulator
MMRAGSATQDRRVRRTQQLLARALIALTLEKGYDAITIRDITERADIGYATFFRHYADKEALLQDVADVVLEDLLALLAPPMARQSGGEADATALGTVLFRYAADHNEVCRVLLGSRGSSGLMDRLIEAGTQSMLGDHTPAPESPVPPEIAAHHVVAATVALIQWWLEHGMPYPPERMGQIYHELIFRPTQSIAFND